MFSVIPYKFVVSNYLTDSEFRLLSLLLTRVNTDSEVSVYYKDLAKLSGKPVKEVISIVKSLSRKNIAEPTVYKHELIVKIRINYFDEIKSGVKEEVFKFTP